MVGETYPLLRKTTGTLVLRVTEEFDDALLIGGKATVMVSIVSQCNHIEDGSRLCACTQCTLSTFNYKETYPATSRVISLTKAVRLDRKPFLLEILAAGVLGVTSVQFVSLHSLPPSIFSAVSIRCVRCATGSKTYCGQR